ncbi:hypothetical protein AC579_159 [Pseudocercospora musae]|uniref:Uncharacterized protein n=1 Tax=Pseudocercospora musae TaxID=113226 RepID=A0A139IAF0_9PEZI|nr:hypothetical protein AC579_159 [Pseudocercospora musae]
MVVERVELLDEDRPHLETFGDVSSAKIPEFHVCGQSASALVDSIKRLASAPGISKLSVVASRKNGHIVSLARLTTKWITAAHNTWLGGTNHESSAIFPCGHKSHANAFYLLHHATELEAAELTCTTCGHYVAVPSCHDVVGSLKHDVGPPKQIQVNYDELTTTIDEMHSILETPEYIDPFGLCPTTYAETATVQMHFYNIISDDSGSFSVSLEDGPPTFFSGAINSLRHYHRLRLQDGLDTVLPVRYICFLRRWRSVRSPGHHITREGQRVGGELDGDDDEWQG